MRIPYIPNSSLKSRRVLAQHLQMGGGLPGYQSGTGFFGNLLGGFKKIAMPVLKAVGKAALPMAQQAIGAALSKDGSIKDRFRAAAQSAGRKENLLKLGRAGFAAAKPLL